ncbi:MAG: hypothetical protein ACI9YM_002050 [Brevundimonas sp.]|uniref:hypothetical protein n=1 Tax=Brevundimonas sp. TaxID=1871086 RepID=UPI0039E54A07
MRRALSITLLAVAAAVAATPVAAQQAPARSSDDGQTLGLRYLTWPGRTTPARTQPERPAATPVRRTAPTPTLPGPSSRPAAAIIPHGLPVEPVIAGHAPTPGRSLTPANAWMNPVLNPAAAPSGPAPAPAPTPVPVPVPTALPPVAAAPADPMAPRRDALIFHMQDANGTRTAAAAPVHSDPQPSTAPAARPSMAASTAGPAEQGARYYSVHRQNNRQPDPTPLPATTYVDAIAVDLPASLASQDLAAPPEPPTLVRNAQGRLQAMPDTSTPDQL